MLFKYMKTVRMHISAIPASTKIILKNKFLTSTVITLSDCVVFFKMYAR